MHELYWNLCRANEIAEHIIRLFCLVSEIIIFKRPHDKIGKYVEEVALATIVEAR